MTWREHRERDVEVLARYSAMVEMVRRLQAAVDSPRWQEQAAAEREADREGE